MGALYNLELLPYIEKYKVFYFVETGTGQGVSLIDTLKYPFEKWYSVEYHPETYKNLIDRNLFDENVLILNEESVVGLEKILDEINKTNKNALFFLDAHFANSCDFLGGSYFECQGNNNLHFPLENELRLIKTCRPNNKDVIICDDVRIYQDGPFTGGNWDLREFMGAGSLDFAYELFEDTHNLRIDYLDQGYLFIEPKI